MRKEQHFRHVEPVLANPNFGLPSVMLAGIPGKPSTQTGFGKRIRRAPHCSPGARTLRLKAQVVHFGQKASRGLQLVHRQTPPQPRTLVADRGAAPPRDPSGIVFQIPVC